MFVFVILNYQSLNETIIETKHIINDLEGDNHVVIVDNASPNGSGDRLKKFFSNNSKVDVIQNSSNSGYAKGNNLGIRYTLRNYKPEFIVLANNDIEFTQNDFTSLVKKSYDKQSFDILGPDILVPETGIHQNPKQITSFTVSQVKEINQHAKKLVRQNIFIFSVRAHLKRIVRLRKYVLKKRNLAHKKEENLTGQKNVVLHGSLLVFSQSFFDKIDTPFDEGTFFYFETEILDRILKEKNMVSKYEPNIIVKHHQNTSTKLSYKKANEQQKFQLTNMIKSTQRFIDLFS